jgi:hypothetical protein
MRLIRRLLAVSVFSVAIWSSSTEVAANRYCIHAVEECFYYFGCGLQIIFCDGNYCHVFCPCSGREEICISS